MVGWWKAPDQNGCATPWPLENWGRPALTRAHWGLKILGAYFGETKAEHQTCAGSLPAFEAPSTPRRIGFEAEAAARHLICKKSTRFGALSRVRHCPYPAVEVGWRTVLEGSTMRNSKIAVLCYGLAVGFILVVAFRSPAKVLVASDASPPNDGLKRQVAW
jgi:hypothetical protein